MRVGCCRDSLMTSSSLNQTINQFLCHWCSSKGWLTLGFVQVKLVARLGVAAPGMGSFWAAIRRTECNFDPAAIFAS